MKTIRELLVPEGSKRQVACKVIKRSFAHPEVIAHYLTPYKIKRACHYLLHDGIRGFYKVLEDRMLMGTDLELELSIREMIHSTCLSDYPKLEFRKVDNPEVSIIIPVHNQFDYTYSCLRSILEYSEDVSYEVILADDGSSDLTSQIASVAENIRVIRTENQMFFLKNCNHASKYARGIYILFLNNDTQVQKNWIRPLINLMQQNEKAGLVGSRLVYPDGRLQEAGGILWNDGSAWNYGNGRNPALPEFCYVKEADYISGASIMIRKGLWGRLGGFDEQFAPAYCEDSDLAFSVRKAGYQVLYQPASVVVHFEGASNGTDVKCGIKSSQIINQKKFFSKWETELTENHLPNGKDVFLARDRSIKKRRILIADYRVPCFDKDAGARTVIMYTKLFVESGMKVTFLPEDFYPRQPYTEILEQMGVEVLYGKQYVTHWKEWLEENAGYFDYAFLNRPLVAMKYIDILKRFNNIKVFYYGHDLHYLREERQYEITHDEEYLKSSKKWRQLEFQVIEKSDIVYAVGTYEKRILEEEFPQKTIRSIPPYIYEPILEQDQITVKNRKDLLFVGGFGHPPNVDAVMWFAAKVFPEILRAYPDIEWNIVGANPPEQIAALEDEHIHLLGYVSDERLQELYHSSRLAVIPLRFGAGVKGKVVESVYYRCPMITTPIGAEGLPMEDERFVIVNADENMAKTIIDLYSDDRRLYRIIEAGLPFINNHFTRRQALEEIMTDMEL